MLQKLCAVSNLILVLVEGKCTVEVSTLSAKASIQRNSYSPGHVMIEARRRSEDLSMHSTSHILACQRLRRRNKCSSDSKVNRDSQLAVNRCTETGRLPIGFTFL